MPETQGRLVVFNWRDLKHPRAGGAEYYTDEAAKALVAGGHEVILFTSRPKGAASEEWMNGYRILRRGNALTCRIFGAMWLLRNRGRFQVVIDEVNTLPWLSPLICPRQCRLLIHQLAREVWLAEAPPIIRNVGFALEQKALSIYRRIPFITISRSSERSLRSFGLIGRGEIVECPLRPPTSDEAAPEIGLIGYVGRLAPSKRVDHILQAFALVGETLPAARLIIIGDGPRAEVKKLRALAKRLQISDSVHFLGRVNDEQRDAIMRRLDVLVLASLREGWGLVVSEAARFGVPSVAYSVNGLIDAIIDQETGLLVTSQRPSELARGIVRVIRERGFRSKLGDAARKYIEQFSYARFAKKFLEAVRNYPSVSS